ncbi:MAG: type II toxin-antitoxin system prevent-host-death family antitoxin [Candidatus Korobacteraceae bacterium]
MASKALAKKKSAAKAADIGKIRQVAAGEFKAKCLAIIDEVNETGQEVIITKRGKATAKLIPFRARKKDSFLGRLEGIMKINGDPDDLIKPIFPLEDWDMLK